ncbi:MAG: hypothetical protein IE926_09535 [Micrococcales bacterium]|uniref:hypothetical protein n=1 Tax=Phycicoccus sp. TaxID=1902410 RepID=UPI0019C63F3A|nr:hypothetical protein [Phycicoccus sp.]MBD3783180.1 hypothetical protein [Micrococcales bacterium]HMM93540.1 hypothetical protein [Phycicoccus sp.]
MSQVTGGPAGSHPTGTVRLTLHGSGPMAGLTPTVHVGGHLVRVRWGTQDVPVWAGRVRVEAYSQWLRRYGQAEIDVDVAPGEVVPVHYAPPWHQFARGAIGTTPQRRPGAWFNVAVFGLLVGVPLLIWALAVFAW